MDLNAIASQATRAVTPSLDAQLWLNDGTYATADDGTRTPSYNTDSFVTVDMQPLSGRDLKQLEGLNIQGVQRVAYVRGDIQGLVRVDRKGGDLIVIPADPLAPAYAVGSWLVVTVMETWPDWCKVGLTLQVDPPA